jgi:hypothetical protein
VKPRSNMNFAKGSIDPNAGVRTIILYSLLPEAVPIVCLAVDIAAGRNDGCEHEHAMPAGVSRCASR